MRDTRISWNPGFVAAMGLMAIQHKDDLISLKYRQIILNQKGDDYV